LPKGEKVVKWAYISVKYPFLAIHAKGGESISPKQKDRTTTYFQNFKALKASFVSPARKNLGEPAPRRQILARQIPRVDTDRSGCPVLLPFGATGVSWVIVKTQAQLSSKHSKKKACTPAKCLLASTDSWLAVSVYIQQV
jgi:hypothetical protein